MVDALYLTQIMSSVCHPLRYSKKDTTKILQQSCSGCIKRQTTSGVVSSREHAPNQYFLIQIWLIQVSLALNFIQIFFIKWNELSCFMGANANILENIIHPHISALLYVCWMSVFVALNTSFLLWEGQFYGISTDFTELSSRISWMKSSSHCFAQAGLSLWSGECVTMVSKWFLCLTTQFWGFILVY